MFLVDTSSKLGERLCNYRKVEMQWLEDVAHDNEELEFHETYRQFSMWIEFILWNASYET